VPLLPALCPDVEKSDRSSLLPVPFSRHRERLCVCVCVCVYGFESKCCFGVCVGTVFVLDVYPTSKDASSAPVCDLVDRHTDVCTGSAPPFSRHLLSTEEVEPRSLQQF
jgi:hypothetical protein